MNCLFSLFVKTTFLTFYEHGFDAILIINKEQPLKSMTNHELQQWFTEWLNKNGITQYQKNSKALYRHMPQNTTHKKAA